MVQVTRLGFIQHAYTEARNQIRCEQNTKSIGDPDDLLQDLCGQCLCNVESASINPASRQNFRMPFGIMGATSGMVSFASMHRITVSLA